MDNLSKNIGKQLLRLREENGFTQEDIQRLTGINRTTYSKNESGKTVPSLQNLRKFAKMYGVTLDFICGNEKKSKVVLYDSGKNMTKEEKILISFFRLLDEEQRKELLEKLENDVVKTTSE